MELATALARSDVGAARTAAIAALIRFGDEGRAKLRSLRRIRLSATWRSLADRRSRNR